MKKHYFCEKFSKKFLRRRHRPLLRPIPYLSAPYSKFLDPSLASRALPQPPAPRSLNSKDAKCWYYGIYR